MQDEGHRVQVRMDGATGIEAVVQLGNAEALLTGNRAVVLTVLARQLLTDRGAGRGPSDEGWVHDDDLTIGVWGREGLQMDVNGLHVLIYRLRQQLARKGIDGGLLEKRRKATRLLATTVELPE